MRLWLITCPDNFAAEYDDIEEMFRRGLTRLILDKRGRGANLHATPDDYERWLLSLPMDLRDRIWVRGTPDLAEQLDVRGCVCEAQSLMGVVPESWKRVNCVAFCRSVEQVENLPEWVAGALLGPVMQPQSALEVVESLGTSLNVNAKTPLILWGGVDTDSVDEFKKMSPAGVASLGGIWNYADPVNAFIKLNRAVAGI
ncbi:hypothetical protein [Fibrobacter sp. UWB12]|uniref:hypothetical protein n=1 Tax=Fibrobacter sp. UWB12 TaxID=1896203 RepID=UPI0009174828|nr:hypothetical protein [Fibrobacter sp. UWB12]SHK67585.1 hypothetical protein SAMN05720759_10570 [Fibrobacter sp. UWB12]